MPTIVRVKFRRNGHDEDGHLIPAYSEDLDLDQLTPRARALAESLHASMQPGNALRVLDVQFECMRTNAQVAADGPHRAPEHGPVKDPDKLAKRVINWGPFPSAGQPIRLVDWLEDEARKIPLDWYPVGTRGGPRPDCWREAAADQYLTRGQAEEALRTHGAPLAPAGWQTLQRTNLMPPDRLVLGRHQWRPETVEAFARRERELWPVSRVAEHLGLGSAAAAGAQMRRWGILAEGRQPGRTGENLYPADFVQAAHAARPGRGARTDLRDRHE